MNSPSSLFLKPKTASKSMLLPERPKSGNGQLDLDTLTSDTLTSDTLTSNTLASNALTSDTLIPQAIDFELSHSLASPSEAKFPLRTKIKAESSKKSRPERAPQKNLKKKKRAAKKRLLAVAMEKNNPTALLECFYSAHLLKKRDKRAETAIIIAPENRQLAEWSGLFDSIVAPENGYKLRDVVRKIPSELIYLPALHRQSHRASLFNGKRIRIGGIEGSKFSLIKSYHLGDDLQLRELKKRGYDLSSEPISLPSQKGDLPLSKALPANFVWFSLFDRHDINSNWPSSHAARLLRLLASIGIEVVLPLPDLLARPSAKPSAKKKKDDHPRHRQSKSAQAKLHKKLSEEVKYLQNCGPKVHFFTCSTALERIAAMAQSMAVVAASGPETLWANILRRPAIALHDMRSFRPASPDPKSPAAISSYIRFSDSLEKQLIPSVEGCIENCPSCQFRSCVDYISPERVFENLKQAVAPYPSTPMA